MNLITQDFSQSDSTYFSHIPVGPQSLLHIHNDSYCTEEAFNKY